MQYFVAAIVFLLFLTGAALLFYKEKKKHGIFSEGEHSAPGFGAENNYSGLINNVKEFLRTRRKHEIALAFSSLIFLGFYLYRLLLVDSINSINNFEGYLNSSELIFITVLRWLTVAGTITLPVACFTGIKELKNICALFMPVVFVLNVVFFNLNMAAFMGPEYSVLSVRGILFAVETALFGGISVALLAEKILLRDFKKIGLQALVSFGILFAVMLSVFPQNMLFNLFGESTNYGIFTRWGNEALDFSLVHRVAIYLCVIVPTILTVCFMGKGFRARNALLITLALAGFSQYFYSFSYERLATPTGLPIHLCNTAIILLVLAFVFRLKSVFYFTYFVNVIGAFFAIALPNTTSDIFTFGVMHFWFNHWYAFFVPILAITLKVFPRPNLKLMRGAILVFAAYFITVVILNVWLINVDPGVDYFFINGDTVTKHFEFAETVRYLFVRTVALPGQNIYLVFHYMYYIGVFIVYVGLMFFMWLIYSLINSFIDHYTEAVKLMRADKFKGTVKRNPLNADGVNMIIIENFSKMYGNTNKYAVKNFNLTINDGEVIGFIGHNGAGKSTTIKSLVGIQTITLGRMEVNGFDIAKQPLEAKKSIGYVSDNHAVYEHLTGREYINYAADLYGVKKADRDERIAKYAEMFGLSEALDRQIKGYSHGMKQKVMVISSLVHNPKAWVLDEPLTGLDPTSAYQIKECMKEHSKNGNIVFFSSHVIEVVERVCTRIAIIARGELAGVYTLAELKEKGISLEDLYMSFAERKNKDVNN